MFILAWLATLVPCRKELAAEFLLREDVGVGVGAARVHEVVLDHVTNVVPVLHWVVGVDPLVVASGNNKEVAGGIVHCHCGVMVDVLGGC